ncbi:hypothetical protein FACS189449_06540 [Alphaproteobacteria bacterium]|nr:hypothetical protein FACS189449_06540 [Alphaproteobacteria bacterium]
MYIMPAGSGLIPGPCFPAEGEGLDVGASGSAIDVRLQSCGIIERSFNFRIAATGMSGTVSEDEVADGSLYELEEGEDANVGDLSPRKGLSPT